MGYRVGRSVGRLVGLFACVSIGWSICLCLSIRLTDFLSVCLSVSLLSIHLSARLFL